MIKFSLLPCITAIYLILVLAGCEKECIEPPNCPADNCIYEINNQKAIARVLTIKKGNTAGYKSEWYDRFLIVHISDSHVSGWSTDNAVLLDREKSCKNLKEAVRFSNQLKPDSNEPLLGIHCMVSTGDMISNAKNDSKNDALNRLDYFMTYYNQDNRIPSLFCTGNHDNGMMASDTSAWLTKQDIHNATTKKLNTQVNGLPEENYFYKDIANGTGGVIRIISLDMLDQTDFLFYNMQWATYSQKQISWLCNVALKEGMTPGHSVIILNHYPLASTYHSFPFNFDAITNNCFTHDKKMIPEIVEAFRKKESLVKTYAPDNAFLNNHDVSSISVNVDFSSTPGEFVCYLGGHLHVSTYFYLTGQANMSITLSPQLMILCSNQAPEEIDAHYNKVYREKNTVTSNAFQIYAVDTKEGNIYMTYFGAYMPADDPSKAEIEKITYR